jgi:hypothetical protein
METVAQLPEAGVPRATSVGGPALVEQGNILARLMTEAPLVFEGMIVPREVADG